MNILKKTFSNLFETRNKIRDTFKKAFSGSALDEDKIELIEDCLLSTDISWRVTEKIIEKIKKNFDKNLSWEEQLTKILKGILVSSNIAEYKKVILMIGVNGAGKTTSSAKLANFLKDNNKKVSLVGSDTFRAAAIKQLKLWSDKLNVEFISNSKTSDPASVVYDGVNSGLSKNIDHIIVDTAGRLQNSINLMNELQKIYNVTKKLTNQITVVINLDANIGQNSLKQVEEFNKYIPIDSIILNKMDGTARGGIAISIIDKFKIPVSYLGVGEKIDNIIPFDIDNYISSLIEESNN